MNVYRILARTHYIYLLVRKYVLGTVLELVVPLLLHGGLDLSVSLLATRSISMDLLLRVGYLRQAILMRSIVESSIAIVIIRHGLLFSEALSDVSLRVSELVVIKVCLVLHSETRSCSARRTDSGRKVIV